MINDLRAEQCREWALLYGAIKEVLGPLAEEDAGGERKDYLLVEDNLGLWQHRIETDKLDLIQPAVVGSLQKLLIGYPNWEILMALGRFGGLVIRDDEIMDGLRRENLPDGLRKVAYEGSRPEGSRFSDILYSGSGRF